MALRPFVPFLLTICFYLRCSAIGDEFVGCLYESSLCAPVEVCIDDGLFGRCQQEPFDLYQYALSDEQALVFSGELEKLVENGADWGSPGTQCSLLYVMMVQRFAWNYHPEFCTVGDDTKKVWQALRAIESRLLFPSIEDDSEDLTLPTDSLEAEKRRLPALQEDLSFADVDAPDYVEYDLMPVAAPITADTYGITDAEEKLLSRMIGEVMKGKTPPELNDLSDDQLNRFYRYLDDVLRTVNDYKPPRAAVDYQDSGITQGEVLPEGEEPMGLQLERPPIDTDLYKKDAEYLGILNQGTGDKALRIGTRKPVIGLPFEVTDAPPPAEPAKEHKLIVVDGNRIYIRLNKDMSADPVDAFALVKFFERKLGFPPGTFVDTDVQGDEVSFTVDQSKGPFSVERIQEKIHDARMVAKKYAREIVSNYKADVLELGQGSGDAKILTEDDDDGFILPIAIVCGSVLAVLVVVFGVYVMRTRAAARAKLDGLQDFEAQPSKAYEELCRQRMSIGKNGKGEHFSNWLGSLASKIQGGGAPTTEERVQPAVPGSKTSSTSSWNEEPAQNSMDISTGHMILNYMEEHLNGEKLAADWRKLQNYVADPNDCFDSMQPENVGRNRHSQYVPYDHNRIRLSGDEHDYVNASPVVDVDPRCAVYLATQGPLPDTTGDFWQMVWEQGSVVIVNLTKLTENGEVKCCRYWPENGSEVYNHFEVHLVSEHIWCEDYLVRSFYLKNLRTNETRTVTQFHFLTWPDHGAPPAAKPLLEFRRKVNKSYRGRQCPIVVHCSDGCGRTGTYILLDLVLNRVYKGAKEMDIAAALEHLRDQRWGMVETRDQFEFVLGAVAEEVHSMLKALPST